MPKVRRRHAPPSARESFLVFAHASPCASFVHAPFHPSSTRSPSFLGHLLVAVFLADPRTLSLPSLFSLSFVVFLHPSPNVALVPSFSISLFSFSFPSTLFPCTCFVRRILHPCSRPPPPSFHAISFMPSTSSIPMPSPCHPSISMPSLSCLPSSCCDPPRAFASFVPNTFAPFDARPRRDGTCRRGRT